MPQHSNVRRKPGIVRASAQTHQKHCELVRILGWHQDSTRHRYYGSRLFLDLAAGSGIYYGCDNAYGYPGIGSSLITCGAFNQLDKPWAVVSVERHSGTFKLLSAALLYWNFARSKVKLIEGDHNNQAVLETIVEYVKDKGFRLPGGLVYLNTWDSHFPSATIDFLCAEFPTLDHLYRLPAGAFKRGANGNGMRLHDQLFNVPKDEIVLYHQPSGPHQWVTVFMTNDLRTSWKMHDHFCSSALSGNTYHGNDAWGVDAWDYMEGDLCLTRRQKNDKRIIRLRSNA